MTLNKIEEAIEDIKAGKIVIVVDDEDRENEGDFIAAASDVTAEMINFMATHGRGLICASVLEKRCKELDLELMVNTNTALHHTPFTVSVDLIGDGCTTGISASDRAKTIKALVDPNIKASDLGRPGHIFPLQARDGGVLRRTGHTEAAVDLARLAGLEPAGVLVEILNEDGTMARLPELFEIAKKWGLKIISIEDLVAFRMQKETLIKREIEMDLDTEWGPFKLIGYKQLTTNEEHIAVVKGKWDPDENVLVRVHSSTSFTDILGSLTNKNTPLLHHTLEMINKEDKGVVVYMKQNGKDYSILERIKAYNQDNSNPFGLLKPTMDQKDFGVGAQILRDVGIRNIRLISNRKLERTGLHGYGLDIVEYVPIA